MVLFRDSINLLVEEVNRGGALEKLRKEYFILLQTDKWSYNKDTIRL